MPSVTANSVSNSDLRITTPSQQLVTMDGNRFLEKFKDAEGGKQFREASTYFFQELEEQQKKIEYEGAGTLRAISVTKNLRAKYPNQSKALTTLSTRTYQFWVLKPFLDFFLEIRKTEYVQSLETKLAQASIKRRAAAARTVNYAERIGKLEEQGAEWKSEMAKLKKELSKVREEKAQLVTETQSLRGRLTKQERQLSMIRDQKARLRDDGDLVSTCTEISDTTNL